MTTNAADVSGIETTPLQTGSQSYRAVLSEDQPAIELTGQPSALTLVMTMPSIETKSLFPSESIPVTAIDFERQGEGGDRVSSVVSRGEILYPEFTAVAKAAFKPPDFVGLDALEGFRIEQIGLDPEIRGLRLRLSGTAGFIRTGSQEYSKDHRLTAFDVVRGKPVMIAIIGVVGWLLPTVLAGHGMVTQLRSRRT
jgi:hypothetical protein